MHVCHSKNGFKHLSASQSVLFDRYKPTKNRKHTQYVFGSSRKNFHASQITSFIFPKLFIFTSFSAYSDTVHPFGSSKNTLSTKIIIVLKVRENVCYRYPNTYCVCLQVSLGSYLSNKIHCDVDRYLNPFLESQTCATAHFYIFIITLRLDSED